MSVGASVAAAFLSASSGSVGLPMQLLGVRMPRFTSKPIH